jgi:hypothetical protein
VHELCRCAAEGAVGSVDLALSVLVCSVDPEVIRRGWPRTSCDIVLNMVAGTWRASVVAFGIAPTGNSPRSALCAVKTGLFRLELVRSNSVSSFGRVDKVSSMADKRIAGRTGGRARSGRSAAPVLPGWSAQQRLPRS